MAKVIYFCVAVYNCLRYVYVVVTNRKFLGTPCIMEQIEKRKLGQTFRARGSDNPNALVKPKILGIEILGTEGTVKPPRKNLRERQGYARISLEIDFKFKF